jgi:hypothetical protein
LIDLFLPIFRLIYLLENTDPRVYFIYRGDLAPSCVNGQQDSAIYTNAEQAFVNAILKNANELQSASNRRWPFLKADLQYAKCRLSTDSPVST